MNNKTNTELWLSDEYKFDCFSYKRACGVAVTFVLRALEVVSSNPGSGELFF